MSVKQFRLTFRDEKNRYFFGGNIEKETIKGWGYPRYNVSKIGPMAGTRMAVDQDAPEVARFITLGGDPYYILLFQISIYR